MSEENIKENIEKYKNGNSSLEEEKALFQNSNIEDESITLWSSFVKKNTIEAPENLNEMLWSTFDEKTKRPNKFKIGLWSAAASIALLFSIFFYNSNQNELSESEKEALLNTAISMFENANQTEQNQRVIIENDLVIVYAKTE